MNPARNRERIAAEYTGPDVPIVDVPVSAVGLFRTAGELSGPAERLPHGERGA